MARKVFKKPINEGADFVYEATLRDLKKQPVPAAAFTAITLVLHDGTGTIVNSVGPAPVSIFNVGRGSVDATTGKLTITFTAGDAVILNDANLYEKRVALIAFDYNSPSGVRHGNHEVEFKVRNLVRVP